MPGRRSLGARSRGSRVRAERPRTFVAPPSSFLPTDIAGLELWLDAEDAATITGTADLVDGWDDKSASGNDVEAFGAQRPSQVTINSLNAIRFDGFEKLRRFQAGITGLDGPDISVFVVANKQFDETDSFPGVVNRSNTAWTSGWRMADGDPGSGIDMDFSANGYTIHTVQITSTATGADAFHLWAATFEGTAPLMTPYLNNVAGTTDNSGDITGSSSFNLGVGNADESTAWAMFGSVGELVIYNSVLSTADRLSVSEYLADKWGITLP